MVSFSLCVCVLSVWTVRACVWTVHAFLARVRNIKQNVHNTRGTGGTTKIASFLVKRHAIALEHNVVWCKQATDPKKFPILSSAKLLKKLSFICIDTETKIQVSGGFPVVRDPAYDGAKMGRIYVNGADTAMELMS